jgi:hypothetical protein
MIGPPRTGKTMLIKQQLMPGDFDRSTRLNRPDWQGKFDGREVSRNVASATQEDYFGVSTDPRYNPSPSMPSPW